METPSPVQLLIGPIEALGRFLVELVEELGQWFIILWGFVSRLFTPPYRVREIFRQMAFVGVGSIGIVTLTGIFAGAAFALQTAIALAMMGAEGLVGSTVALALTREVAPMLTALMVTGRAGSAMAATLGTMKVTEQVDALEAMAVDPIEYLVVPRVIAATLMLPCLTMIFNTTGILGSWFVAHEVLNIDNGMFWGRFDWYLDPDDITDGLIKAAVFGFLLSWIGCAKGMATEGGAEGVGTAATRAVVYASVSILVSDYFITRLLY